MFRDISSIIRALEHHSPEPDCTSVALWSLGAGFLLGAMAIPLVLVMAAGCFLYRNKRHQGRNGKEGRYLCTLKLYGEWDSTGIKVRVKSPVWTHEQYVHRWRGSTR